MTYDETRILDAIERLAGRSAAALTQDQRDQLDQFHAGGPEAVDRILPGLGLTPGTTALDVGSGLGGPARQVARRTGSRVVGVDLTPAYVDGARALTIAAGLDDQVEFHCRDIAALESTDFDAAFTMHVQMNVEDKKTFFAQIARRLRPGAHFAVFDVCRNGDAEPTFPLPWSLDGADSHLAGAEELRDIIESCGFEPVEWVDETGWVVDWFGHVGERMQAAGTRATLPALLNEGPTRMVNFAAALAGGVLSVHRGAFTFPGEPR